VVHEELGSLWEQSQQAVAEGLTERGCCLESELLTKRPAEHRHGVVGAVAGAVAGASFVVVVVSAPDVLEASAKAPGAVGIVVPAAALMVAASGSGAALASGLVPGVNSS
jgi:hypothetical protein